MTKVDPIPARLKVEFWLKVIVRMLTQITFTQRTLVNTHRNELMSICLVSIVSSRALLQSTHNNLFMDWWMGCVYGMLIGNCYVYVWYILV